MVLVLDDDNVELLAGEEGRDGGARGRAAAREGRRARERARVVGGVLRAVGAAALEPATRDAEGARARRSAERRETTTDRRSSRTTTSSEASEKPLAGGRGPRRQSRTRASGTLAVRGRDGRGVGDAAAHAGERRTCGAAASRAGRARRCADVAPAPARPRAPAPPRSRARPAAAAAQATASKEGAVAAAGGGEGRFGGVTTSHFSSNPPALPPRNSRGKGAHMGRCRRHCKRQDKRTEHFSFACGVRLLKFEVWCSRVRLRPRLCSPPMTFPVSSRP